jgi:hypothetical protein
VGIACPAGLAGLARTSLLIEAVCSDGLSIRRVGEQLERHADKHRFPMRIRPGDRPPVQRFANRPLNVELLQALEGRSGNWAALRAFWRTLDKNDVQGAQIEAKQLSSSS